MCPVTLPPEKVANTPVQIGASPRKVLLKLIRLVVVKWVIKRPFCNGLQ